MKGELPVTRRAVLFDLDGTLLDLDVDGFMPHYMDALTREVAGSLDPGRFQGAVMAGTRAMIGNDGRTTNEEAFWRTFEEKAGVSRSHVAEATDRFYREVFPGLSHLSRPVEEAARVVEEVKRSGALLVVATNAIFPRQAILERLRWAKVDPGLFDLITSYEIMHASKPNPAYYLEICDKLGIAPADAVMVGNDPELDIRAAQAAGLRTYLVEDGTPAGRLEQDFAARAPSGAPGKPAVPDGRGPLAGVPSFLAAIRG